jgi:hypothetical protein
MQTPVVFIIFNRPDCTKRVLTEIAKAKPGKLFIVADGPRSNSPSDFSLCNQARNLVSEMVNWDCEVLQNYSEKNLGCGRRVATGLSWVFENVPEAIILEDDCVPHPDFFLYCRKLLAKYRDDKRVMMISGRNHLQEDNISCSYSFRRMMSVWGWATWSRAWEYYDYDIKFWEEIKNSDWMHDLLGNKYMVEFFGNIFDKTFHKAFDTWDYQWLFACWLQNGFCLTPKFNLVQNIGFGPNGTHTKSTRKDVSIPQNTTIFPLKHPPYIIRNTEADIEVFFKVIYRSKKKKTLLQKKLSQLAKKLKTMPFSQGLIKK